jgi:predicted CxxxxCH...CXXCH cytochrome family protein
MHRTSAFPLDGKHADVSCAKCHTPAGRATVYHTGKLTCSACHADQHAGEFAASPYGNQCQFCHSASGFEPTSFSLLRHAKTSFPLTGGHASVECRNCHQPPAGRAVITQTAKFLPPRQFHFPSQACNTCHSDPHSTSRECEQCHVQDAWRAVRPFNHDSTRYPLRATHKEVACTLCHNPPGTPRTLAARVVPVFSNTPTKCSECHAAQDPHGGQFAKGARVEDCSACHVESSWKKTTFDHDRARFALDIAHRNVTCVKCHKDRPGPDAKLVRSYRDTPRECVKCH